MPRLAGLTRGRDNDALHRVQDGIGTALVGLNATGAEAERERAMHLSSGLDTGPLLRTILRLRHDVVMIERATVVPLPSDLQARLAAPLSDVSKAIVLYMRAVAGRCAPVPTRRRLRRSMRPCNSMPARCVGARRGSDPRPAGRGGGALLRAGIFAGADAPESVRSRSLRRGMAHIVAREARACGGSIDIDAEKAQHQPGEPGICRSLQLQSILVFSQCTGAEFLRAASIRCLFPPGPSPPSPFHRQMKIIFAGPKRAARSSIQRLLRS